jgi:hypothetical protein
MHFKTISEKFILETSLSYTYFSQLSSNLDKIYHRGRGCHGGGVSKGVKKPKHM